MEKIWKQIDHWMDLQKDRMTEDLRRLVRIRSVSDSKAAVAPYGQGCRDVMEEMLLIGREHGLFTDQYDGHVGYARENAEKCDVALWGHLDVVEEGDGWIYPPYEGVVKGEYLIGRGSADNKGPLIACLYALTCLKELGIMRHASAGVYFGCNEEAGMEDIVEYLKRAAPPKLSLVADSGFPVCYGESGFMNLWLTWRRTEPGAIAEMSGGIAPNIVPDKASMVLRTEKNCDSSLEVAVSRNQEGLCILEATGVSGHTAFPQGSRNAIGVLARYVLENELAETTEVPFLSFLQQAAENFRGGALGLEEGLASSVYCIPTMLDVRKETASLLFNLRYPSGDSGAEDPTVIPEETVIRRLKKAADQNGCTLEIIKSIPPKLFLPKEHPWVQTLAQVYDSKVGYRGKPFIMGGGCYARCLPNALGFGPGPLYEHWQDFLPKGHGGAHGPDECQHLPSMVAQAKLYAYALVALDRSKVPIC